MPDITLNWNDAIGSADWMLNEPEVTQVPVVVSSPQQFGIGDGVTAQFALAQSQSPISNAIAQIYRTDWQGTQLLYATPRTNAFAYSQDFTQSPTWVATGLTITTGFNAPDGSNSAQKIADDSTAGSAVHDVSAHVGATIAENENSCYSIYIKPDEYERFILRLIQTGVSSNYAYLNFDVASMTFSAGGVSTGFVTNPLYGYEILPDGWYRFWLSANLNNGATSAEAMFAAIPASDNYSVNYVGTEGSGAYFWGAQLEPGTEPTAYIPTTTAPVTVTDYVLAPNGIVTLSSAPILGATLDWTGSYTLNVFQQGGYLETGNDLQTAILISIFTDRIADIGDVIPDGSNDPRGWWADGDVPIGSRMWLLRRAKQTLTTLQLAYDYLAESLQWLIDDEVVGRFDIQTQWVRTGMLGAQITAYSPAGTQLATGRYTWAWAGIN